MNNDTGFVCFIKLLHIKIHAYRSNHSYIFLCLRDYTFLSIHILPGDLDYYWLDPATWHSRETSPISSVRNREKEVHKYELNCLLIISVQHRYFVVKNYSVQIIWKFGLVDCGNWNQKEIFVKIFTSKIAWILTWMYFFYRHGTRFHYTLQKQLWVWCCSGRD